jgi:YVTN family beta-propeller protein
VALALLLLVGATLLAPSHEASAEATLGGPIPVGSGPWGTAVDPTTNRIYVVNGSASTVSVIDGTTNGVLATIPVGTFPSEAAVNTATHRVFVTNGGDNTVSVVDSTTNAVIATISVGANPFGVAVNQTTNRVYVANSSANTVTVIDGATNTVVGLPIPVGSGPDGVAVNAVTNRVNVANFSDSTISVVDGASDTVAATVTGLSFPIYVAVNPVTNRIFVANNGGNSLSVIDGSNDTVIGSPLPLGGTPFGVGVNPNTNRVYVAMNGNNTVRVVDGGTNALIGSPVGVGTSPFGVAVNAVTNRVYVVNNGSNTASVIGVPFSTGGGTATPGSAVTATWSDLFGPTATDAVGLFQVGAPNTSPVSLRYTNDTTSPSGLGVAAGSVHLPIPAGLAGGAYEIRLVSGASGGTYGSIGLTVAATPSATNDSYPFGTASTLTVAAPGVLANDTDADSPSLSAAVVTNPSHGTLVLQPTGAFTYTPDATFAGTDSFTYRATDPTSLSSTATVTITAAAPVAADDSYAVDSGGTLTVPGPGVLANDTDADSPALSASVVTPPIHGTLTLQPGGAFTYTPAARFAGTDRFTYRATDQTHLSSTASVSLTVNPMPCGAHPTIPVRTAVLDGVLSVEVEAPNLSGPLRNQLLELRFDAPVNGRVTLAGVSHIDAFTHTVTDGSARLTFTVQRVTAGQATTVPFTVVDRCGSWQTFVGGGTGSAF